MYLYIRQNRLQDNVKIEWNFLLKRLIHKDIPTVTNIWGPHKTVSKFLKLKLTELMSKTNISSSVLDNRTRQKKHELKNYVNNLNLMPYILHPMKQLQNIIFLSVCVLERIYTITDHMQNY